MYYHRGGQVVGCFVVITMLDQAFPFEGVLGQASFDIDRDG